MTISEITYKTKCDFCGCKNMAEYVIADENDNKKKLCFCRECLNSIYQAVAKITVPKGMEAPFKKPKKLR